MATTSPFAPHLSTDRGVPAGRSRTGRPIVPMQPTVSRRGNMEQGQALEVLGHALEYLEDSRMYVRDCRNEAAELEANSILRRASRAVFLECPVIVPLRERLSRWMAVSLFGMSGR